MKATKIIIIFLVVFMVLVVTADIVFFRDTSDEGLKGQQNISEEDKSEAVDTDGDIPVTAEECVNSFLTVIYDYDTGERNYYEGAEEYMTKTGYERFVPLQNDEEAVVAVRMKSVLEQVKNYSREMEEGQKEFLSEVYFRISGSGESRIRQIVRLKLIMWQKRWLVDECIVLDTLEE